MGHYTALCCLACNMKKITLPIMVSGTLMEMPTNASGLQNSGLAQCYELARKTCFTLKKEKEALLKKNRQLVDELLQLKKTTMKSLKNEKTELQIKQLFASHMFRKRKFITNEAEQKAAGEEMHDYIY